MAGLVQVHFNMGITLMLFRYIFLSGFIMVNDIDTMNEENTEEEKRRRKKKKKRRRTKEGFFLFFSSFILISEAPTLKLLHCLSNF